MVGMSLLSVYPNCTPTEGNEQTNIILSQSSIGHFAWRPTYVPLLPAK